MGFGGGLMAGLAADALFGSFAVPIKTTSPSTGEHDPICFQCYKSFTCFFTSLAVLLVGTRMKFTWFGFFGAMIWTFNGIFGVLAVQWSGISVAQSIWSAVAIFVSFFWGAFVFEEPIQSASASMFSLFVMVLGICGVAYASSPKASHSGHGFLGEDEAYDLVTKGKQKLKSKEFRQGVACATYMGVSNGSYMVPMKYVEKDVGGSEYLLSFGVGAAFAACLMLAAYYPALQYLGRPRPKLKACAKPGIATGMLWSAGNYCGILAIQQLGLTLGWPLVQCQFLISAAWGIFYFKEVTGAKDRGVFFFSGSMVLLSIWILSTFGVGHVD